MQGDTSGKYVHGYAQHENARLVDQATTLVDLLHHDSIFDPGSQVLEAGCGVGAQTVALAGRNPDSDLVAIDISAESVEQARERVAKAGLNNVTLRQADIWSLPFDDGHFDHVFVCFVLEHLSKPVDALKQLMRVLKPGGAMTVIEGDHGSTYFHPHSDAAVAAIDCQVRLQSQAGGNARIGRELFPLLTQAGLAEVNVSPRMVYVDSSRPGLVEGFTKNTFTAMIHGVREQALEAGIIDAQTFDQGIADLYRTTEDDGVFCYTFFKATSTMLVHP